MGSKDICRKTVETKHRGNSTPKTNACSVQRGSPRKIANTKKTEFQAKPSVVKTEGEKVDNILLDTGCSFERTYSSSIVPQHKLLKEFRSCNSLCTRRYSTVPPSRSRLGGGGIPNSCGSSHLRHTPYMPVLLGTGNT